MAAGTVTRAPARTSFCDVKPGGRSSSDHCTGGETEARSCGGEHAHPLTSHPAFKPITWTAVLQLSFSQAQGNCGLGDRMGRLWDSGRMGTSNTSSAAEQPATGSLNTASGGHSRGAPGSLKGTRQTREYHGPRCCWTKVPGRRSQEAS